MRGFSALLLAVLVACTSDAQPNPSRLPVHQARVVATFPHDRNAFTQGLFFADGQLYESTGLTGASTIRRVRLEDGRVLQFAALPDQLFGEGSVDWNGEIISLTWRDGIGYRWDRATLRRIGSFTYAGEGWGLTRTATELVMSDGTAELRFLDPRTLRERRRVRVTADGRPVDNMNELEFVRGEILANVWQTNRIARIDPATGQVRGWIDLTRLVERVPGRGVEAVPNGIAYDPANDRLFVTGKNWPALFEIELVDPSRG